MTDRIPIIDGMAARVRGNAMNAAIAAAFLLYFGFAGIAEPVGTGLFERSGLVFYHTLRIGGVAMAIVAIVSMSGHPIALLIDAIAAALIGALLILTGGGMMAGGGGGMQTVINILCGLMFLSSAKGVWADFAVWKTAARPDAAESFSPPCARMSNPAASPTRPSAAARTTETPSVPLLSAPTSLAGQLRDHRHNTGSAARPVTTKPTVTKPAFDDEPAGGPGDLAAAGWSDQPRKKDNTKPAPDPQGDAGQDNADPGEGGGFLAAFADDGPPPKP